MMAHSTHDASASTGALPRSPQSLADAVAHRIALVQRLCTAGRHRDDPAFQRRVDGALAEAGAALAAGNPATETLETTLRALDALTFELCEE